ncbi:V-snare-domain-containing protein [Pisolithus marmoratus]|nr:V-snare-domain-containing protein [Pisolithus marmoratus]
MATYDTLHRQCRTLESLFDTKLTTYSRMASAIARNSDDVEAGGSRERWRDVEGEVEDLLEKTSPPSQFMSRAIQRHREVYQDYLREFHRTKGNVKQALEQTDLLAGVRNDIDAYKSSTADALLAERGHIDSSHRMTDDILDQAYETRAEFSRQRTTLSSVGNRMATVVETIPGINNLLSMIKSRRRRDSIILGTIIAVCMVLLLSYMTR